MGSMIVIEGLDGCGKNTQSRLLLEKLTSRTLKTDVELVDFPRHGKTSFYIGDRYLQGEFGSDPNLVDPYLGSLFYSVDRSLSYKVESWGRTYDNGGIVICDRYITSNVFHQGSKFASKEHTDIESLILDLKNSFVFKKYISWLYNLEFNILKIPVPSAIFILETPEKANIAMLNARKASYKNSDDASLHEDIHETNLDYLSKCRAALWAYKDMMRVDRNQIHCDLGSIEIPHIFINVMDPDSDTLRKPEDINSEIMHHIMHRGLI